MDISSQTMDNVTVVRLEGNLDTNTSTEAQDSLNKAIDDGAAKIVVSFDKVDFVSSAGLRVLLHLAPVRGQVPAHLRERRGAVPLHAGRGTSRAGAGPAARLSPAPSRR